MKKRIPVPQELEHLIEKRESQERRQKERREDGLDKNAEDDLQGIEEQNSSDDQDQGTKRRSEQDRRQTTRRDDVQE